MKKLIYILITTVIYSTHLNAQKEGVHTPEWVAFKYFQDSLLFATNNEVKYYFGGKVSGNCSTMPYGFTEINYNMDTCMNQKCMTRNIDFIANQKIRSKRFLKKINLYVDSACKIDADLYLVNIIYSNKNKGVIYHIFIKDKLFYKLKTVNYIH